MSDIIMLRVIVFILSASFALDASAHGAERLIPYVAPTIISILPIIIGLIIVNKGKGRRIVMTGVLLDIIATMISTSFHDETILLISIVIPWFVVLIAGYYRYICVQSSR